MHYEQLGGLYSPIVIAWGSEGLDSGREQEGESSATAKAEGSRGGRSAEVVQILRPVGSDAAVGPYSAVEIDLGRATFLGYTTKIAGTVLCSPKEGVHPERERIQQLHEEWVLRVGLWDEANLTDLAALQFSRLWTGCIADVPAEVASVVPDYCLMFTVLDDTAERYFGQSGPNALSLLRAVFQNYMRVLEGEDLDSSEGPKLGYPKYVAIGNALADLRDRVREHASPRQYARFLLGMRNYFRGVIQQAYLSSKGAPLSRETQVYNREISLAFQPTVELMAILRGIELEDDVLQHPLFERVYQSACRVGGIINDIISFPKEVSGNALLGQYHNIVAAEFNELAREASSANLLELALRRVFRFHNNEMCDFLFFGSLIEEDEPSFGEFRELCALIHRSWMEWCLTVERYSYALEAKPTVVERPTSLEPFQVPALGVESAT